MRVRGAPAVPGRTGRQVRSMFAYLRVRCSAGARRGLMGRRRRRRPAPTGREEGNCDVERDDTAEHNHDDRWLPLDGRLVHPCPRGLGGWGAQRSRRPVAFGRPPRRGRGGRYGRNVTRGRLWLLRGGFVWQQLECAYGSAGQHSGTATVLRRGFLGLGPGDAALHRLFLIVRRCRLFREGLRDGWLRRELGQGCDAREQVHLLRTFWLYLFGDRLVGGWGQSEEIIEIRQRGQLRQRGELGQRSKPRKLAKLGEIRGISQRLPVPSIGGARRRLVVGAAGEVVVAHETFLPCNRAPSALAAVNGTAGRPHARKPRRCRAAANGRPTRRAP